MIPLRVMLNYHRMVISLSFGLFKEFLYLKEIVVGPQQAHSLE